MLDLKNIKKAYNNNTQNEVTALTDVSLTLGDRGLVFVLGKSGCGKSTLLNVIGGLDSFDSGELVVEGKSMDAMTRQESADYRNSYVGFVFQENNLIESMRVDENLTLALELQSKKFDSNLVTEILEKVGLEGLDNRKASELSGGQKQRVAIARALIKKPRVILADEPTGNLDSKTGTQIFELLREISKEKLVVVVTHDELSARQYGDRIIELSDGNVVSDDDFSNKQQTSKVQYKATPLIKSLSSKSVVKFGIKPCKKHAIRLIATIILFMMSLTMFTIGYCASDYNKSITEYEALINNGKDTVFMGTYPLPSSQLSSSTINPNISFAQGRMLEQKLVDFELCKIYNSKDRPLQILQPDIFNNDWFHGSTASGALHLTSDKLEEYGMTLLAGRLPSDEEEIAIPWIIYDTLQTYGFEDYYEGFITVSNYNDILGREIPFNFVNQSFSRAKIVGVVDTGFDFSKYEQLKKIEETLTISMENELNMLRSKFSSILEYSYHNAVFISEAYEDRILNVPTISSAYQIPAFIMLGQPASIGKVRASSFTALNNSEASVVWRDGLNSLASNQVLLSKGNLRVYYSRIKGNVRPQDVTDANLYDFISSDIATLSIMLSKKNIEAFRPSETEAYTIVGYYDVEEFSMGMIFSDDVINSILGDDIGYRSLFAKFSGDKTKDYNLVKLANDTNLDDNYSFPIKWELSRILCSNDETAVTFKQLGLYGSILFLLFTILMMINFISASIRSSKKDIGILSALGTRNLDIVRIYSVETIIICVLAFGLSTALSYLGANVLNTLLGGENNLIILLLTFKHILVTLAVSFGISITGLLLPLSRLLKRKPVDILRN